MIESFVSFAFYISTAVTLFILLLPSQYAPKRSTAQDTSTDPKTTVQILVLGDIGRSPRMQYHALSIAKGGGQVEIIGYHGMERFPFIVTYFANVLTHSRRVRSSSRNLFRPQNLNRCTSPTPSLSPNQQQTSFPSIWSVEGPLPGCMFVVVISLSHATSEVAPCSGWSSTSHNFQRNPRSPAARMA